MADSRENQAREFGGRVYIYSGRPRFTGTSFLVPGDVMFRTDGGGPRAEFTSSRGAALVYRAAPDAYSRDGRPPYLRDMSPAFPDGADAEGLEAIMDTARRQGMFQDAYSYRADPDRDMSLAMFRTDKGVFSIEKKGQHATAVNGLSGDYAGLPVAEYADFNPDGGRIVPESEFGRYDREAAEKAASTPLGRIAAAVRGLSGQEPIKDPVPAANAIDRMLEFSGSHGHWPEAQPMPAHVSGHAVAEPGTKGVTANMGPSAASFTEYVRSMGAAYADGASFRTGEGAMRDICARAEKDVMRGSFHDVSGAAAAMAAAWEAAASEDASGAGGAEYRCAYFAGIARAMGLELDGRKVLEAYRGGTPLADAVSGSLSVTDHELASARIADFGDGVKRDGLGRTLAENGRPERLAYLSPGAYLHESVKDAGRIQEKRARAEYPHMDEYAERQAARDRARTGTRKPSPFEQMKRLLGEDADTGRDGARSHGGPAAP